MACQDCLFEFLCIRKNLLAAGSVDIENEMDDLPFYRKRRSSTDKCYWKGRRNE